MRGPLAAILILISLMTFSCNRSDSGAEGKTESLPRTFSVRGFLRQIDFAGQSVTVEHEAIPDYMPAMTMPFDVKTMAEVEPLKAGDAIEFKLLVSDQSSWIEGVKKIAPADVR